jgi:pimeloyl-ACP methyl ester carboxylesterase
VLVLTPGKSSPLSDERLGRIGNNVRQVIALTSAHWIHLDQPDLVIDSIRKMTMAADAEPVAATG